MLVLSRKTNESIVISKNIEVKVVEVRGDYVKLGITAPREISVHRKEIYEAICKENSDSIVKKQIDENELEEKLKEDQDEDTDEDKEKPSK